MNTSYPYLTLSRAIGAPYSLVLHIVDKLDAGYEPSKIVNNSFVKNVYYVWKQEQDRRKSICP